MAKGRRRPASTASQSFRDLALDDHVLLEVLRAAKQAGTLAQLASLSKHLCSLARSSVCERLSVRDLQDAELVLGSHAHGRAPFSGCRELSISAPDLLRCCLVGGVLRAAEQWPALQHLNLSILAPQTSGPAGALCATSLLSGVPALQQLRHLVLDAPVLGASSAQHIVRLPQLTSLRITAAKTASKTAGTSTAPDAAADLSAMSDMTRLVELRLNWALAPHLPAGPEGPYCFPSSLVTLELSSSGQTTPAPMAAWLAHLPGCVQLQHLQLDYGQRQQQHHSAHPRAVVGALAQHEVPLRTLSVQGEDPTWDADVAGLADAEGGFVDDWCPDACLAALTGLVSLSSCLLHVYGEDDWQHLAQLTALRKLGWLDLQWSPPLGTGVTLAALEELEWCDCHLTGHELGCLFLACPAVEQARVSVGMCTPAASTQPAGPPLPAHPALNSLRVADCYMWSSAESAAAHFGKLAPVLGHVSNLSLCDWPEPSGRGTVVLPDLSPCTAVTSLAFACLVTPYPDLVPYQEDLLSMVVPLVQLQHLEVRDASWVNPRVALGLQSLLPNLQHLAMVNCGWLSAAGPAGQQQQQQQQGEGQAGEEEEVLAKLQALLRPGLSLTVEYE